MAMFSFPEPVTMFWRERGLADVIKLSLLRWGDYLGLSVCAPCNLKGLYNRIVEKQKRGVREEGETLETETGRM